MPDNRLAGTCTGSGRSPSSYQRGSGQCGPCATCGAVVSVYMRRLDRSCTPDNLIVADHAPSERAVSDVIGAAVARTIRPESS